MKDQDRVYLRRLLSKYIASSARVLDVGCGLGNNILLLKEYGYENVVGVDISSEMIAYAKSKDCEAYTLNEFSELKGEYDLILFSHVLEHLEYRDLQTTMEFYFSKLRKDGKFIVLSPVLYDAFFCDVDHVKPYYPIGLLNLFSRNNISRQYTSKYIIKLLDIHFRRATLLPYCLRSRYVNTLPNRLTFAFLSNLFEILRVLSLNLFSKTTGYCAIFEVNT